jgi:hypothetical protein
MSMEELCTSALAFSKSPFSLRKKQKLRVPSREIVVEFN